MAEHKLVNTQRARRVVGSLDVQSLDHHVTINGPWGDRGGEQQFREGVKRAAYAEVSKLANQLNRPLDYTLDLHIEESTVLTYEETLTSTHLSAIIEDTVKPHWSSRDEYAVTSTGKKIDVQ